MRGQKKRNGRERSIQEQRSSKGAGDQQQQLPLPFPPLLFSALLLLFLLLLISPLPPCDGQSAVGCSLSAGVPFLLSCPSASALLQQFNGTAEGSKISMVREFELNCEPGEEANVAELVRTMRNQSPRTLRHFSAHHCGPAAVQFAQLAGLDSLNLSHNGIAHFPWQQLGRHRLRLLDLRNNPWDCGHCGNRWTRVLEQRAYGDRDSQGGQPQAGWTVRAVFPNLPDRVLSPVCSFAHCPPESARFDRELVNSILGAPLQLKCQFGTQNPLQTVSNSNNSSSVAETGMAIFDWPLSETTTNSNENSSEAQTTLFLPAQNAALLRVPRLLSAHLGFVACRCVHCSAPTFGVARLRFPVPLTVTIPPGQPPGEQHLIAHGFPLEGPMRMRVSREQADGGQRQIEWARFSAVEEEEGRGQEQPRAHLFFNNSLSVRPEPEHWQFFLRYFSLAVHECTHQQHPNSNQLQHCGHSQSGGTFHFQLCTSSSSRGTNDSGQREEEEWTNCGEVSNRLEPPAHPVSNASGDRARTADGGQQKSSQWSPAAHLLISFPLSLFSLLLLAFGAKTAWRLRQRMAIREKLKRRARRSSRNTQRTEETSIPLDTLSRTLSLSPYVGQQVPIIPAAELQLNERIGKGAFGEVFVAIWRQKSAADANDSGAPMLDEGGQQEGDKGSRRVAVKMLSNVQLDAEMDREAALLARLEHANVLRMFGIAQWSGQVALVLELMNLGDLRNYLRNRTPRCNNYAQFPAALLPSELVDICLQICEGLCYLAQQQIVHRDLAARNCLVSGESDMRCCSAAFRPPIWVKISDFGMSRKLYSSIDYYKMQDKRTALPVRWCPPECLSSGKFTQASDIWSFGVLLYEIFSFGAMPFGALSNEEVLTAVLGGMRPEVPEKCRPELADLMRECWHRNPQKRINAHEALARLRLIHSAGQSTATGTAGGTTANGHAGGQHK